MDPDELAAAGRYMQTREYREALRLGIAALHQAHDVDLLKLLLCEECVEEHVRNTQSISCYCACHNSARDEANWQSVRDRILAALKG